jgi:phosphoglycolate phosphatase
MNPQLLIFDLDGTLIDSRADLAAGINYLRALYGLDALSVEQVGSYVGDGVRRLIERSLADTDTDFERSLQLYKDYYYSRPVVRTSLYSGVAEGIPRLASAGHQLALLTNKPGDPTRSILKHFQLDGYFHTVIGGGDVDALKPNPAGIVRCMEAAGTGTGDTWMAGDHCTDLAAAENAGIRSAFMRYGFGEERGYKPTVYFTSFSQLVGYFV